MAIGVFGGTFDPIHNGHLAMAEEVRAKLNLTEVLFVPAGQPWLKTDRPIAPARDRVEMVRLALTGRPYFRLSTIEIEQSGPSYTVDTVAILKGRSGKDELYFIMGWDSLSELWHWKEPSRLISLCRLVVVPRPGFPPPELDSLEGRIPGLSQRLMLMDSPVIDISSSNIRERVAAGLPIHVLVPEAVEIYIREHRLYIQSVTD